MIDAKNLDKYYFKGKRNELHVLNDISLSLPDTGFVVILGKSGSGKTTLLNTLGGLDCANGIIDYGSILFGKYEMKKMDAFRNKNIGYVFQNYLLLPDEFVFENLDTALKIYGIQDRAERKTRIDNALKAVGMAKYRRKKASSLSGGQQQRVGIARALAKLPKIIIADEPTGNLDSENSLQIMSILQEVSKDCLVLMVTHSDSLAKAFSDRIIRYADGKIISDEMNVPDFDKASLKFKETSDKKDEEAIDLKKFFHETSLHAGIKIDTYRDDGTPSVDLNLKIIEANGKKYIYIDDENVVINDRSLKIVSDGEADAKDAHKDSDIPDSSLIFDHKEFKDPQLKQITFMSLLGHSFSRFFSAKKFRSKLLNIVIFFLGVLFASLSISSYSTYFNASYSLSKKCVDTNSVSVYYNAESSLPVERKKFTFDAFAKAYKDKNESGVLGYVAKYLVTNSNFDMTYSSGESGAASTSLSIVGEGVYSPSIAYGRFPDGKYEIAISKSLIDEVFPSFSALGYKHESLLGRKFYLKNYGNYGIESTITNIYYRSSDVTPTIVGITSDDRPIIHISSDGGYELFTSLINSSIQRTNRYLIDVAKFYKTSDVSYALPTPTSSLPNRINVYANAAAKIAIEPTTSTSFPDQYYYADADKFNIVGQIDDDVAEPIIIFKEDVDYNLFLSIEASNAINYLAANADIPSTITVSQGRMPQDGYEYLVPSNIYEDPGLRGLANSTIVGCYQYSGHDIGPLYTHPLTYYQQAFALSSNYLDSDSTVVASQTFKSTYVRSLYTSDVNKTLEYFSGSAHNFQVTTTEDALARSNQLALLASGSIQILFVALGTLVLLIFMIVLSVRSSMIHHIYNIGVYRSIGATRSYVEKIFIADSLSRATMTSILGTVLTFVIYYLMCISGAFIFVPPYILLLAVALLYGVSLLGTIIPLSLLLRKTPYQIVTKYDI